MGYRAACASLVSYSNMVSCSGFHSRALPLLTILRVITTILSRLRGNCRSRNLGKVVAALKPGSQIWEHAWWFGYERRQTSSAILFLRTTGSLASKNAQAAEASVVSLLTKAIELQIPKITVSKSQPKFQKKRILEDSRDMPADFSWHSTPQPCLLFPSQL